MKKRLFRLALILCLLIGLVIFTVGAEDAYSGKCGENLYWKLDLKANTLTISGTGEMYDCDLVSPGWEAWISDVNTLVVEEGVDSIGKGAFQNFINLSEVVLPDTLITIGEESFAGCEALTEIELPESLKSINTAAFSETGLVSFRVPEGVTQLPPNLFYNSSALAHVELHDGITQIREGIFSGTAVEEVQLPQSITSLNQAFRFSNIKRITVPEGVTRLCAMEFDGCNKLEKVVLPNGIVGFSEYAFHGCFNLTSINLPESLSELGNYVFTDCTKLYSLKFSGELTQIGTNVFYNCVKLSKIIFTGDAPCFDEKSFEGLSSNIYYPKDNESWSEVVSNQYGGTITWNAYSDGDTIPSEPELTDPEENRHPTGTCGESVNWYYDSTTATITISGSGKTYDYDYYMQCSPLSRFSEKFEVRKVVVEEGITALGAHVLSYMADLETVILPEGLEIIGDSAFSMCGNITRMDIPNSVTYIGQSAFSLMDKLTEVKISDKVTVLSSYVFSGCPVLTNVTLPKNLEIIEYSAFRGCKNLREIRLPDSLRELHNAFEGCTNLVTVNIPSGLTIINLSGTGIKSCVVPDGVTELQTSFSQCYNLEEVILPDTLTKIGFCCFSDCEKLQSIQLPKNLKEISSSAFKGSGLREVVVPYGTVTIAGEAFQECPNLTRIELPETLKSLERFVGENEKPTIVCKMDTLALGYAISCELPIEILPDEEPLKTYQISGQHNGLGTVSVLSNPVPAGRYVILLVRPFEGCTRNSLDIYDSEGNLIEVECAWYYNNYFCFAMPEHDIFLDIKFDFRNLIFKDVPLDSYYVIPVMWASTYDITTGTSYNTFSPNDPCSRGQVVTFLWRAAGCPEPESLSNPFTDVKESDYFHKAVLWAVENGITNGMTETTFAPKEPCTRAQVATFLWRAAGKEKPSLADHSFTDLQKDVYYYDAVLWAVEWGITNGTSDTTFSPGKTCTRAQIVTFLYRFLA